MKVIINRFFENENTTLGCMQITGINKMLFTCENAWKNNERNISCIPVGEYKVEKHLSPTHNKCFKVLDVKNRDHILFHKGNTHINTQGCILLGLNCGELDNLPAVFNSLSAMEFLLKNISTDFDLEIISNIVKMKKMCYY